MTNSLSNIEAIVKKVALANADFDIKGIAVVFVNSKGDLEIELSFAHGQAFAINTGIDLLKHEIILRIKDVGKIDTKDRE